MLTAKYLVFFPLSFLYLFMFRKPLVMENITFQKQSYISCFINILIFGIARKLLHFLVGFCFLDYVFKQRLSFLAQHPKKESRRNIKVGIPFC